MKTMDILLNNPIKNLKKREWCLWISSLLVVIVSNFMWGAVDVLTLLAACVGITSLIFAAKGNVWAPILMVLFSILYGVISFQFCYWGEMITYLGMTLPMSIWSVVTWMKHPTEQGNEVAIHRLNGKQIGILFLTATVVTVAFFFLLKELNTPNILFSTLSVTTSFLAAALTMLRSSYYALGYAFNDIILVVLWVMASMEDSAYIPVVVNFIIFFVNDMYGFISWKKRERIEKNCY